MKKILLLFLVLALLAGGALWLSRRGQGGAFPSSGSRSDRGRIEEISLKFMEDLRFKDFQRAASYHSAEDRKKVNIPGKIESWFAVKPEQLDIMRYEVLRSDIDSTGLRGRVKLKTVLKVLNTSQIRQPEIMLFFFKDPSEGWIMELESSL